MFRKCLSVLLAVCFILSAIIIVPASVSAKTSGDYEYYILGDGTARIKGYTGAGGDVTIPSVIGGHTVTSINSSAFSYCDGLTSITIPDSVTSIGDSAFHGCTSLTSITLPETLKSIGESTFLWCTSLQSINIPSTVSNIGDWAFAVCTGLTEITIPDSVRSIGVRAFGGCTGLTNITIGNSVESIGSSAFEDCTSLTSIVIPDSVTSISYSAFSGCSALSSVIIGKSATDIQWEYYNNPFRNCNNLTTIIIDEENTTYDSRNNCNAVIDSNTDTLIFGCAATVVPDTVSGIGKYAFFYQPNLTTITIPNSVTSIGASAFSYCRNLTSITLSDSVTSIGHQAFFDCSALSAIDIPESVTVIGSSVFSNCSSLATITVDPSNKIYDSRNNCNAIIESNSNTLIYGCKSTVIPETVTAIEEYAFVSSPELTAISVPASVTSIGVKALGYKVVDEMGNGKIDGFIIYGYTGTEAERYATDNGFTFIALDTVDTSKVTITKTDIKADSVFNNDGYGSLRINPSNDDGQTVSPQAALIDCNGTFLFPYKETQHRYYISDNIVSLVSGPYTNYADDPVGFYTLDGDVAFAGDYYGATNLKDGYAFVTSDCNSIDLTVKSYLIDQNGQVVAELQDGFNQLVYFGAGDTFSRISAKDNTTANLLGDLLLCWSFASMADYCNGVIESIYYMDRTGQKVLELPLSEYASASSFSEGLAAVQSAETGKWGYIDKTGDLVIPCQYDDCGYFADDIAKTRLNNKWGYINAKNEVVIPFAYDAAFGAGSGLASVGKGGKFGLVDYNNHIVVPFEYDDISSFEGGVAYAVKDGYVYIITLNAEQEPVLLGDADGDGIVTVFDATAIQRQLVGLSNDSYVEDAADADGDGRISVFDATEIQRHLVGLSANEGIGKPIV